MLLSDYLQNTPLTTVLPCRPGATCCGCVWPFKSLFKGAELKDADRDYRSNSTAICSAAASLKYDPCVSIFTVLKIRFLQPPFTVARSDRVERIWWIAKKILRLWVILANIDWRFWVFHKFILMHIYTFNGSAHVAANLHDISNSLRCSSYSKQRYIKRCVSYIR